MQPPPLGRAPPAHARARLPARPARAREAKSPLPTPPPAALPRSNFRARRLSVSDIEQDELAESVHQASLGGSSTPKPGGDGAPGRRARRLSLSPEMGAKAALPPPFGPERLGTYSCHGVEPGMRQGETSAKINQDRGCTVFPFGPECPEQYVSQALFCVYDGHGAVGDKVSHFVAAKLTEKLEEHPGLLTPDPTTALKEAFVNVDKLLKQERTIDAELSGTTGVVILLRKRPDGAIVGWTAWVGDSRAVLATKEASGKYKGEDLSDDHKPDTPKEQARILAAGGFVSPPEEEWGGPARVWLDANMTLPGLAMARSIGDHLVKSVGVTAEPEVKPFALQSDKQQIIVLASDGVWEFISSQSAIDLLEKQNIEGDATMACTKLIETAAAKWRQEEGDYRDDITAICFKANGILD
jgi:protein phosphatase 2C family protein 2/3